MKTTTIEKPHRYTTEIISQELDAIARGAAYYGSALLAAIDMPGISDEEKQVLERYLRGCAAGTDAHELQRIAINLRDKFGGNTP